MRREKNEFCVVYYSMLGFVIIVFIVYRVVGCLNICYSILFRIFVCRSIRKGNVGMSRLLFVDLGEVICVIFIREVVKVCVVF